MTKKANIVDFSPIISSGEVAISTPFNRDFIQSIKKMGGVFRRDNKVWVIKDDPEIVSAAKELCLDIFGSDGDTATQTITVRATGDITDYNSAVCVGAIPVARAFSRDSGAVICEGATLLKGEVDSCGSTKNWRTRVKEGAVIRVEDFPVGYPLGDGWEVVNTNIDRESLEAEKTRLVERLAEIEKLLSE